MPKDIKSAQRFLGMANYYRTFIPECSKVAKPLIDFISKKVLWGPKVEQAVMQLKSSLVTAPVLVPFVVGEEYRLTTDASLLAMGAVLERIKNGRVHGVVGYFSKIVTPTQARYHVGEIELLAIIVITPSFQVIFAWTSLHVKNRPHIVVIASELKRTQQAVSQLAFYSERIRLRY